MHPDRLDTITRWLQQEDDELLYAPDRPSLLHPATRPWHYRLDGHTPVPEPDLVAWGSWFVTADRTVARTWLAPDVEVSTVFLGLDHAFQPGGPPLLFETMIFGGRLDGHQERFTTWAEAVTGHEALCAQVAATLGQEGGSSA